MGHGEGHGAWGMGHGALRIVSFSANFQLPIAHCPLPTARGLIAKQLFADLGGDKRQL